MPEKVLLVMAEDSASGKPVAGALNLIGSHALFGRNWGCMYGTAIKNLHFELCYYQVSRPFMGRMGCAIQHLALLDCHHCKTVDARHRQASQLGRGLTLCTSRLATGDDRKSVDVVLHIRLPPCSMQACCSACLYVSTTLMCFIT